jgi:four helix bundle suffix protein
VQNIAEGSQAAGTSKKIELKLTNVARVSLEELRLDYEDFLRQRGLPLWERQDPKRASLIAQRCKTADCVALWVKEQSGRSGLNGPSGLKESSKPTSTPPTQSTQSTYAELSANAVLVLIAVACGLLDRQLTSLAAAFEREGGFTERLYRVRKAAR